METEKVLFLSHSIVFGGHEKMWTLAVSQLSSFKKVSVYFNKENTRLSEELSKNEYKDVELLRHSCDFKGIPRLLFNSKASLDFFEITKNLKSEKYCCIIVVPGSIGDALLPAIISLFVPTKFVCYLPLVNSSTIFNDTFLNKIRDIIYYYALKRFKKIIVVTNQEKIILNKKITSASIDVIKNYHLIKDTIEKFSIKESGVYKLCLVSRLDDSQKAISSFIKEIGQTSEINGKHFIVDICGEGNDYLSLKNLVSEMMLDQIVRFKGFQTINRKFFIDYDCLVISSKYESGPLTLIEALSAGVPVVSTRVGYSTQLLNEKCLFNYCSNEMIPAIVYTINNKNSVVSEAIKKIPLVVSSEIEEFRGNWLNNINKCNLN